MDDTADTVCGYCGGRISIRLSAKGDGEPGVASDVGAGGGDQANRAPGGGAGFGGGDGRVAVAADGLGAPRN